ncbi:hypothetical protein NM09_12625 [Vibrio caribbeanicus]|uniref:Uncharacterized protein n=3 Tax=Vibrionaceae TaxID=641 RepID=A0A0A5HNY0_PHOS4|nr:hypothetical protein NM06_18020 [Vibrio sinaloensis]KHD24470.1 hypothetical protein NM09_12625 [Vibrio caribbeanicus]KHT41588.1 hypothetical protein RJ47_13505 [Vibrio sinaloensis]KIE19415.1 hypothetical protein SE23_16990 [Vibrio sinaloensis]
MLLFPQSHSKIKMFAKNELVFTLLVELAVKYWPVLVKTFVSTIAIGTVSEIDGAYSNQFITKKLAQSFGIAKIIANNSLFGFKRNENVN